MINTLESASTRWIQRVKRPTVGVATKQTFGLTHRCLEPSPWLMVGLMIEALISVFSNVVAWWQFVFLELGNKWTCRMQVGGNPCYCGCEPARTVH